MDTTKTNEARDQAHQRFDRIINVHVAALNAMRLVIALPEADLNLAALLRVRQGMKPGRAEVTSEFVHESLAVAHAEQAVGFATMRGLTLVSACGALEYLIKATYVDLAATDPSVASSRITPFKLKLSAADVLGLDPIEQWHQIADALLTTLGQESPRMHQRASKMLLQYAPNPCGEDDLRHLNEALSDAEKRLLDEAFLVRNCLVHNGGKVSSALAHFRGQITSRGESIMLDQAYGADLLAALRKFAGAVYGLGSTSL